MQAFTHPLWFLLWVLGGVVSRQWIPFILGVSLALSLLAVWLVLRAARTKAMVFVSLILLLGSNAFMEFTTSGLENPLSFAVIGTYITLLLRFSVTPPRAFQSCVIGVTLAAALLTRMDLAILVLIPTLGFVWHHRRSARQIIVMMTAAIVPLLVWLTWSWVTYASILPNTFAAKRNLDIPLMEI